MPDESDPRRDRVHEVLQHQGCPGHEPAVLVGWALVCDWMDDKGDRWLTKAHSATVPTWQANGMWHEALNGAWTDDDEADE